MEAIPLSQSYPVETAGAPRLEQRPASFRGKWRQGCGLLGLLGGGLALRLWMLHKLFEVNGDGQIYGGIAKNLLLHGRFALNGAGGEVYPTLIRLPGYPFFLAVCFRLFGMENYWAASMLQIVLELVGCLLLASLARKITPARFAGRAAWATLALAALCPFTASYATLPLTEAPTLFSIALALWAAVRYGRNPGWAAALAFTAAVTFAALLRPDGVLVGLALAPALLLARKSLEKSALRRSAICLILAVLPFVLWGLRNWKVFHVVQPLAPRYATDPDEPTHEGWIRWIKTWCLDFNCTDQVYWSVPGDTFDLTALPPRAFDSPQQYAETAALANDYNNSGQQLTPEFDARFAQLAAEREAAHPWRSRLGMPLGRLGDMWMRPRIENLPIDLDWRVYSHHHHETVFSWFYVGLNAAFLTLAVGGLLLRPCLWPWIALYILLRCLMLLTVEAPEARYTLECFPMIFVLGGVFLGRMMSPRH